MSRPRAGARCNDVSQRRTNQQKRFQRRMKGAMNMSPREVDNPRVTQKSGTREDSMKTPPIVPAQEWKAALKQLLVKEKALTRSRDALAAERRRMPWMAVEKNYVFEGPKGKVSLLDLFEGRRQLIVYRA